MLTRAPSSVRCILKMPAHPASRSASDEPIAAIYGGRQANHEHETNMVCLNKTFLRPWTLKERNVHCSSVDRLRETDHFSRLIIRWTASVGRWDWSVVCPARNQVHGHGEFELNERPAHAKAGDASIIRNPLFRNIGRFSGASQAEVFFVLVVYNICFFFSRAVGVLTASGTLSGVSRDIGLAASHRAKSAT